MPKHNKIVLTKENFSEIFSKCTGMGDFENPFNFSGTIRENQKAFAMYYLNTVWGDQESEFEWAEEEDCTDCLVCEDDSILCTEDDEYLIIE